MFACFYPCSCLAKLELIENKVVSTNEILGQAIVIFEKGMGMI